MPVGTRLALALLDDGMARAWPVHSDRLLAHGLRVLHEPQPPDLAAITRILLRYADIGPTQRSALVDGIRNLLSGPLITRTTVQDMQQHHIRAAEVQVHVRPATRGLHAIRKDPGRCNAADATADWDQFAEEIQTAPIDAEVLTDFEQAAAAMRSIEWLNTPDGIATIQRALEQSKSASALEAALIHVVPTARDVLIALRDRVLPDVYRSPATPAATPTPATDNQARA